MCTRTDAALVHDPARPTILRVRVNMAFHLLLPCLLARPRAQSSPARGAPWIGLATP